MTRLPAQRASGALGGRCCLTLFFLSVCSKPSFALRSNDATAGEWPEGRALPFSGYRRSRRNRPPSPVPHGLREAGAEPAPCRGNAPFHLPAPGRGAHIQDRRVPLELGAAPSPPHMGASPCSSESLSDPQSCVRGVRCSAGLQSVPQKLFPSPGESGLCPPPSPRDETGVRRDVLS